MSNILIFLLMGVICVAYNKPISKEFGRLYLFPVRRLFGEKRWVMVMQHYFVLWARATLYFGALVSLVVMTLEIMHILSNS